MFVKATLVAMTLMFVYTSELHAFTSSLPIASSDSSEVDFPCDSILIPTDTLEFCYYRSALPLVYEDSNLTETGYYLFHHVTESGCDSDVVVHLVVRGEESRPNPIRITICSNELPYTFKDSVLTHTGFYKIMTQAEDGCDTLIHVILTVNESPVFTIQGGGYICPNDSTTLTVEGDSTYAYLWSTGDAGSSITVDSAGTYYLEATAANGCSLSDSTLVMAGTTPDSEISGDSVICQGESATLVVSGEYAFLWDDSTTLATRIVMPEASATYYVTITDTITSCAKTDSIHVTVNANPEVEITGSPLEICSGDSVVFTAAGGVTYLWSTGETTASIIARETGTYQVTATNEFGCSSVDSISLLVRDLPTIEIQGRTVFCSGEATTITLSGASTYRWSNGSVLPSLTTTNPGLYTVTCTDEFGCVTIQPVRLSFSYIQATLTGSNTYCQGSSTTLKVVGDSTNTYQWINGNQADSMQVSSAGQVTVIVTNTLGCSTILTANISELPIPSPTIACTQGALTICEGNSVSLRASGGVRYLWSNGSTTNSILVSEQGTYTVTATAINGCSAETSETVIVNPMPQLSIINPDTICSGENVTLHAISPTGRSFSWSSGQTTPSITVRPDEGLSYFMVTVVDNNNCSNTASATVTTVARPSVFINGLNNSTITMCQGGTVALRATTGVSYQWSNGMSNNTIYVSNPGIYTVTVFNAEGCSSSASITVNTNPLPVASITENTTICQGQTATLSATFNAGYTYLWNNGNNTNAITVNTPGTYTVTVTNSTNCSSILSTTLTVNEKPTVSIAGSTSICAGQSTQLTSSANMPCSYVWSTGDTNNITQVNTSNTYRVTATNANGCSNTASVTVVVHALPTPFIIGSTTICKGNSTTLTATGGQTYMWSTGHTSNQISVSPASTITYTVTATDQYGCRANVSATVIVNVIPAINILGNTSFCEGGSTTLSATGGSYYTWSTGDNTSSITVNTVGNYTVTATNSLGCQNTQTIMVTSMGLPTISINGHSNICAGNTDTLIAGGANRYVWSTGETSSTIHVMPSVTTTYTVTGYGYNGCMSTASKVVNIEAKPNVQISGQTTICEGQSTTLTAIGGTSYLWADGSTSDHISVTHSGNYAVVATNAAGCTSSASLLVVVNNVPRITLFGNTTFCENSTSTIMANGGSSYHWSTGNNQSTITLTSPGVYTVTAYNTYGCSSDTSFTAITLPMPTAEISGSSDLCEGEPGYLTVSPCAQYNWSNGSDAQTISFTPGETTTYFVTVTNENGCSNYASQTVYVHPIHSTQYAATICQGNSFNQYGFELPEQNESGTFVFVDSLQSVYGCDSILTLTLTVNPLPVLTDGIEGSTLVSNYGNYFYHLPGVENATIFEWSISNPRWTLSNSNINSVFLDIQNAGSGTLFVKAINACGHQDTSLNIVCNVGIDEYVNDTYILVYPNPVQQTLNINLEKTSLDVSRVEFYDSQGRRIQSIPVNDTHLQMDCNRYANGNYYLKFIDGLGKTIDTRNIIINK